MENSKHPDSPDYSDLELTDDQLTELGLDVDSDFDRENED